MQVGDLVRGETNELLGIVMDVLTHGSITHVIVYWLEIERSSRGWIRTEGLEAICN